MGLGYCIWRRGGTVEIWSSSTCFTFPLASLVGIGGGFHGIPLRVGAGIAVWVGRKIRGEDRGDSLKMEGERIQGGCRGCLLQSWVWEWGIKFGEEVEDVKISLSMTASLPGAVCRLLVNPGYYFFHSCLLLFYIIYLFFVKVLSKKKAWIYLALGFMSKSRFGRNTI